MRVPEIKLWAGQPDDSGEITREFLIADVFTATPLEGNQLGVFPDGRGLSAELMQQATRELNFSESVFFGPPDDPAQADARVRIFTPGGELPFAGHPTLGSAWVLGELLGKDTITLQLGVGPVPVELDRDPAGAITFGRMSQPLPRLDGPFARAQELVEAIGTAPRADGLPVQAYVNGPVNVYVEYPDEETVAGLEPDMQRLARIPANISCFAQTGPGTAITRMFAPALGVSEDPATGSACGPLAVHLARYGRIAFGAQIEVRQGAQIGRPSVLYARVDGSAPSPQPADVTIDRVIVGGRAVVVAHGHYRLS
jgi:trans-2,3-dihydro-3-hydroxyanthranilate isomerase